jgi:hypothetical protein
MTNFSDEWSQRSTAGCSTSSLTMVGTVKRLLTRWRSTSCQTSSGSIFSLGSSTVAAPRATFISAWMPAPCDSGATAMERSSSVVPGIRSARWLVTTKAICPCVSMPALGRPVVPEV